MNKLLHITKIMAALIVFTLFNDSVYSQKVISSVNTGAKAITNKKVLKENISSIELKSKAENWTLKKSYLDAGSSNFFIYEMIALNELVVEEEKEIEGWMIYGSFWKIKPDIFTEKLPEEEYWIQEWMFDENFWQLKTEEEYYALEDWMIDNKFWVLVE